MRKSYTPANWYWLVGDKSPGTQVYSSAVGDYVLVGDPTYQAWLAAGGSPTPISLEVDLGQVFSGLTTAPINANILDDYKTARASNIVTQTMFRVLFNHENRIRTIERALSLNGSPPNLTQQQALAAVKALM